MQATVTRIEGTKVQDLPHPQWPHTITPNIPSSHVPVTPRIHEGPVELRRERGSHEEAQYQVCEQPSIIAFR